MNSNRENINEYDIQNNSINVFLFCYNESALLPHTVKHYKKYLPSCKIIVYDNESSDNSVEIARSLGCYIVSWGSNNTHNEDILINLRNTVWKTIENGWIIIADMDEYVCVTETELAEEMKKGTNVLQIEGKNMIGESETIDLSDIDLQEITKYVDNNMESKNLCFLREKIIEMCYGPGSHACNPTGFNEIKYSSKIYINKHMEYLGLNFIKNKMIKRYERNEAMRKKGWNIHYTDDIDVITNRYMNSLNNSKMLE